MHSESDTLTAPASPSQMLWEVSKPPVEGVIPLLYVAFAVDVVSSAKDDQMTIFRSNKITWHEELVGVHWWRHLSDDYKYFHFFPLSVWLHAMPLLWILSGNWSARTDRRRKGKEWLFKRKRWLGLAREPVRTESLIDHIFISPTVLFEDTSPCEGNTTPKQGLQSDCKETFVYIPSMRKSLQIPDISVHKRFWRLALGRWKLGRQWGILRCRALQEMAWLWKLPTTQLPFPPDHNSRTEDLKVRVPQNSLCGSYELQENWARSKAGKWFGRSVSAFQRKQMGS